MLGDRSGIRSGRVGGSVRQLKIACVIGKVYAAYTVERGKHPKASVSSLVVHDVHPRCSSRDLEIHGSDSPYFWPLVFWPKHLPGYFIAVYSTFLSLRLNSLLDVLLQLPTLVLCSDGSRVTGWK